MGGAEDERRGEIELIKKRRLATSYRRQNFKPFCIFDFHYLSRDTSYYSIFF